VLNRKVYKPRQAEADLPQLFFLKKEVIDTKLLFLSYYI